MRSSSDFAFLKNPALPIVIVDDSTPDLLLAEVALRHSKVLNPVYPMTTGLECIRYFQGQWKSPEGFLPEPCILLLDIAMPVVSGLDVLRAIKHLPLAKQSHLVVVSGILDSKKIAEAQRLGGQAFVFKPLLDEDIRHVVAAAENRILANYSEDGITFFWTALAAASNRDIPRAMLA
jgi:CheY-like chemotaxis protein